MSNNTLTEAERNRIADLVVSRGGDELLITEVLTWAAEVRTGQDQLELVLRGFLMPTLSDDGRLALIPLLAAIPAAKPFLDVAPVRTASGDYSAARCIPCPDCSADAGEPCVLDGVASRSLHVRRYEHALRCSAAIGAV